MPSSYVFTTNYCSERRETCRIGATIEVDVTHNEGSGKRSSRIANIFTSIHSVRWEGGGQATAIGLSKMSFMVHCKFEKGSQSQHFQSTLLVARERGNKKQYSVYVLDNVDNS